MNQQLIQSIKQLKQAMKRQREKRQTQKTGKNTPLKKSQNIRPENNVTELFLNQTFCLATVGDQIIKDQIQILKTNIQIQGGIVIDVNSRQRQPRKVDFVIVDSKADIEKVKKSLNGKVHFKQIIDVRYIYDSMRKGHRLNYEKYSLYVNVQEEMQEQYQKPMMKKLKKVQQSDNETQKLQDSSPQKRQPIKGQKVQDDNEMLIKDNIGQDKRDIQQFMLRSKEEGNHFSVNQYIADQLTKMMKIYAAERDIGRKIAYMKAATTIRGLDRQIESDRDVENLKGIGKKIADKIKELLSTGKIRKLETLQSSEKNIICVQFCKIWGIGPSKAQELYAAGFKSIADLKANPYLLTKNQRLGLEYHDQFEKKIPREKVTRIFEYVRKVFSKLVPSIQLYQIQVCGSYRRLKPTCGDIDIIVARKDGIYEKNLLKQLVNQLEKEKFLTDHLTHPRTPDTQCSISYMGVCQFQDKIHHRIDIKYYPMVQFAYALLYFTGSGNFNRMLRIHAIKMGLNLSDHRVTPRIQNGQPIKKKIPVCLTQEDIFRFLQLEYKAPKDRDM